MYRNILVAIAPDHGDSQVQALHTALHLAHHEDPEAHQQKDWQQVGKQLPERKTARW